MTVEVSDIVLPPNPVREAGYRLRLLLEEALELPPKNAPPQQMIVALCALADMNDAVLSGDPERGYSSKLSQKMIVSLRDCCSKNESALADAYEELGAGKMPPRPNIIERDIRSLVERICAVASNNSIGEDKRSSFELVSKVLTAVNEHRLLRAGKGYLTYAQLEAIKI